jgi:hypothetical protein
VRRENTSLGRYIGSKLDVSTPRGQSFRQKRAATELQRNFLMFVLNLSILAEHASEFSILALNKLLTKFEVDRLTLSQRFRKHGA